MKNLILAIKDWKKLLGKSQVLDDKKTADEYQKATFPLSQKVLAVMRPKTRSDVQECLRIANVYKIPIYPISKGKNWGYGSRVPAGDSVVMDLSRMNKILEWNEDLAYVRVEPGVSFDQLFRFLRKKKSKLAMTRIGGSSESSLIGNFAERGIGKGVYGDRYQYVCNLEVVLPTGEVIYTSEDNFSRERIGPEITGLFTQSNLGIITAATVWLPPKNKYSQALFFYFDKDRQFKKIINCLRSLKSESSMKGNFLIANEFRQLASLQQYPWKEAKGKIPLPDSMLAKLVVKWKIVGNWRAMVFLDASTKAEIIAQRYRIKNIVGKLTEKIFFLDRKSKSFDLSDHSLRSLYWRKKSPIPKIMDPDRDRCGAIWISPMVPFSGTSVFKAVETMKKIMVSHKFEPNIGINCVSERKIHITGAIIYDREVKGEDEKALACHDKIYKKLKEKGYLPYRLNLHSMANIAKPSNSYTRFIKTLKKAIDPNDILSPGRYDFRKYWNDV